MVERQRVTKRHEPHPADAQATAKPTAETPSTPAAIETPQRIQPPAKERPAAKRRVPPTAVASRSEPAEDDGPKIPTSFRLPRSLLNRLDKGSRVIPAELDKNVSKNQIVEMAIDHYLAQYNV